EIGLNKFPTLQGVISAMRKVSPIGGTSNAGRAIDEVVQSFFQASAGNRREAPNAAVLLLDGWPSDDLEVPARAARETGINIFIVTVEGATSEELASGVHGDFVNKSVCRPDGHFSLHTDRWTASSALVSPLVSRVCNNERLICSKTCLNSADLVFVVDGSSSVGHENFPALLEFVANVTGHFEVARAGTHVGIVQYTYEQRTEVELGRHTTPEGVREAVHRVHYWSGGTSTGAAITYTRQEMFAHSHSGKRRLLVLITDGRSYDDVREPAAAARKEGIILYAVGIAWAMKDELDAVANDPKSEHVFFVSDFDDLKTVGPKLVKNICKEYNALPRN
uniref:VWFA domain-containing protein n=1 Tax=Eptatretus burgeri TaxID=7764 RepID=A0A8C4QJW5_EPTBU